MANLHWFWANFQCYKWPKWNITFDHLVTLSMSFTLLERDVFWTYGNRDNLLCQPEAALTSSEEREFLINWPAPAYLGTAKTNPDPGANDFS